MGLLILTVIVAAIPIIAWKKLKSLWLKPKKLEKLLKAQGLQGDPYKLNSNSGQNLKQMYLQQQAKSKPFGVITDVTPQFFSTVHQTVYKYGTRLLFRTAIYFHLTLNYYSIKGDLCSVLF